MKIFINDIPVYILKTENIDEQFQYDTKLSGDEKISPKNLVDDVLILNASPQKVEELLQLMTDKKFKQVDSITIANDNKKILVNYIKEKFKVIEAAGGVVEKDSKNLLIFRQGKWDLPKGKIEKGEKKKKCAIREVNEETGVEVAIKYKIGHTWHTYMRNKKYILKKTHWYVMTCLNDLNLSPQKEEGIDDVKWFNLSQMREALYDSYRSIRAVIQEYNKLTKDRKSQIT